MANHKAGSWQGVGQMREVRNDKVDLGEADAAAFGRLRERQLASRDEDQAAKRAARPVEAIRAMRVASDKMLEQGIPNFQASKDTFVEEFVPLFQQGRSDKVNVHPPFVLGPFYMPHDPITLAPIEDAGQLRWAATWFPCNLPGLTIDLPQDRVLLFGHIGYNSDPLLAGSCGFIEEYVLSPDRFPRTTKTSFTIDTETRIGGIVSGWTGVYHPIWHADDKWCKCWLIVRKTASLSTGEVLATIQNVFPILSLDNVSPIGQENTNMFEGHGGLLQFDAHLSLLAKSGTSILVTVEVRFDVQMEGDSELWIRHTGAAAPSLENAMAFKTRPMWLQPR